MEPFYKGQCIEFDIEYYNEDGTKKNLALLPNFAVILYRRKSEDNIVCKKTNVQPGELEYVALLRTDEFKIKRGR